MGESADGTLVAAAMSQNVSWYAVRVKPNAEQAVSVQLRAKGIEEFLPLQRTASRWSDRTKISLRPLFPGYVFCRLALASSAPTPKVLSTPGVMRFLDFGRGPEPIPDDQMATVERMVDSKRTLRSVAMLRVGQRVRVGDGPLAGVEGILTEIRNHRQLVVNLPLFERGVAVQMADDIVLPCN